MITKFVHLEFERFTKPSKWYILSSQGQAQSVSFGYKLSEIFFGIVYEIGHISSLGFSSGWTKKHDAPLRPVHKYFSLPDIFMA
jgi:hypothetical protein